MRGVRRTVAFGHLLQIAVIRGNAHAAAQGQHLVQLPVLRHLLVRQLRPQLRRAADLEAGRKAAVIPRLADVDKARHPAGLVVSGRRTQRRFPQAVLGMH